MVFTTCPANCTIRLLSEVFELPFSSFFSRVSAPFVYVVFSPFSFLWTWSECDGLALILKGEKDALLYDFEALLLYTYERGEYFQSTLLEKSL